MASLPSTLNTQILDRAKMTPCKFNPLCICSNNGKKEPQDMEDITKGGVLALMYILYFDNGKQRPLNVAFTFLKLHASKESLWLWLQSVDNVVGYSWESLEVCWRGGGWVEMSSYRRFYHLPVTHPEGKTNPAPLIHCNFQFELSLCPAFPAVAKIGVEWCGATSHLEQRISEGCTSASWERG